MNAPRQEQSAQASGHRSAAWRSAFMLSLYVFYAAIFFYVAARAYLMSFTHDESLSYLIFHGEPHHADSANHHLLNTWLMQLFSFIAGEHEFILRLPNVLAFAVFIWYLHRIIAGTNQTWLYFFLCPLILLNPFVLDYFSLARGYGLSLGMMMAALWYFFRLAKDQSPQPALLSKFLLFSSLSVLANLALLNLYIAFLMVSLVLILTKKGGPAFRKSQLLILYLLPAALLAFLIRRSFFLQEKGELYFGTEDLMYTVSSLIERTFYYAPYPAGFANAMVYLLIIGYGGGSLIAILQRRYFSPQFLCGVLITLILLASLCQHYLFGALYPVSRAALYLLVLNCLFMGLSLDALLGSGNAWKRWIRGTVSGLALLAMCLHFISRFSLDHVYEWQYDANTKNAAMSIGPAAADNKKLVAATWIFVPAMQYYNISRKMNLQVVHWFSNEPIGYIYTVSNDKPHEGWQMIRSYPETNSMLFVRK